MNDYIQMSSPPTVAVSMRCLATLPGRIRSRTLMSFLLTTSRWSVLLDEPLSLIAWESYLVRCQIWNIPGSSIVVSSSHSQIGLLAFMIHSASKPNQPDLDVLRQALSRHGRNDGMTW